MELFTVQVARWREAVKLDIPFIDTTVKSGSPVFAPEWKIVMAYKDEIISEAEYRRYYIAAMKQSFLNNPMQWKALYTLERAAIGCYCRPGEFCHRYILKDILAKLCEAKGIDFVYSGEILKHDNVQLLETG